MAVPTGPCNVDVTTVCTYDTCCLEQGQMTYVPSLAGNVTYLTIFAVLLCIQLGLGIVYKTWTFVTWMTLGLAGEVSGYAGRIMLSNDIFSFNAFLTYLIPLTISPAFLTASIYLSLARLIYTIDPDLTSTRLKPKTYTAIFVTSDFISLVLQGAGGGITATANDHSTSQLGINVMIAGLACQVVSLIIFIVLCSDFAFRVYKTRKNTRAYSNPVNHNSNIQPFIYALALAVILILVRSIYRLAELQEGFSGSLANNQTLFMVFEGPMVIIAVIALTVFHPGRCLPFWNFKSHLAARELEGVKNEKQGAVGARVSVREVGV